MLKETPKPPVIFLAFANEYRGRHLAELFNESDDLEKILSPYSLKENPEGGEKLICELIIKENVRIDHIYDLCQDPRYRDRICVFHYGGHADGYQLLLQGKDGENETAHGSGLVSALSRLESLKLVFLNGCSTQKMAKDLVERGVPTVIGTSVSISDKTALELSRRFYKGLASGLTLSGAWELAKAKVSTEVDTSESFRGMYRPSATKVEERFPWDVEFRDEAARELFESWNLPKEARQPLFGLPPLKKQPYLPASPFRFLQPYGPEHAELFFGRARYIRDLYLRIADPASPSILLLYGESGSGKSSLLHAGLAPRLEAARHPDTGKPLYQVRYRRREKELMLVGVLYDMLASCQAELMQSAQVGIAEIVEQEDPDQEKIEQMEAVARELDEKARAYFLASIERFKAARLHRSSPEYQRDHFRLEGIDEETGPMLRAMWREIEKQSGQKLILILDQVEEIFTDPSDQVQNQGELENLLRVLKDIFAPQEQKEEEVKGRIILSYREEFNAKIEARFKNFALARSLTFLEQLNRENVVEVLQGLENSEPNRHQYHITIEERLPVIIADDLLKGKEQVAPGAPPVAPVLQLILRKLWEKASDASGQGNREPQFTVELYDAIQSADGRVMEEFFDESMAEVEAEYPELVGSGLVLDILRFHVSHLGTSESKPISEIRDHYHHIPERYAGKYPPDILDRLVDKLKKEFLLTDNGRDRSSLPHDTLAPIVLKKFGTSEKLGQRSARILDTKRPEYIKAREKNDKRVRLDENDLDVVEGGIPGMRAMTTVEGELLRISREEREKRLRLRRILVQGGLLAGMFILILTAVAANLSFSMLDQLRNTVVDRAHQESIIEMERRDSEMAIKLAGFAYLESAPDSTAPVRTDILHHLYDLYQENSPAPYLRLPSKSPISSMNYDPRFGTLVGLDSGQVFFRPVNTDGILSFNSPGISGDYQAEFTADGRFIQLLSRTSPMAYYLLGGKELVTAPILEIYMREEDYLENTGYWDEEEGYFLEEINEEDSLLYENSLAVEDIPVAEETEESEPDLMDVYPEEEYPENYVLLGYYDFFLGKFQDYFGNSYNRQEFINAYFPISDFLEDALIFKLIQSGDTIHMPISEKNFTVLFNQKLLDEGTNLFRKKAYEKIKEHESYGEVLKDYTPIKPYLKNEVIPLRKTNLVRSSDSYLELWNPDSLTNGPLLSLPIFEELNYIRAIDRGRFLTLSNTFGATVRNNSGEIVASLPHENPREIAISPNARFVLTISMDSVKLWNTGGLLLHAYQHTDVGDYRFSADGARLLTFNAERVYLVETENNFSVTTYTQEDGRRKIATARFHPDGRHLIIGLSAPEKPVDKLARFGYDLKKLFGGNKARIVLWDLDLEKPARTFKVAASPLVDAGISDDGQYAAALTPWQAVVIKGRKGRSTASKVQSRIALNSKKESLLGSNITLSPTGRYIVKLESEDYRLDVYNLNGNPLSSYLIQNQFQAGFKGQVFTPDDQYLVISKPREIVFWAARDTAIRKWLNEDFELSFGEKQAYNIDNINDSLPGGRAGKNWGISTILLSLVVLLLFFSSYLFQFVQQKKYRHLGLILAGFLLFVLTLHASWTFFDAKKLFLYLLFWTTLAIIGANTWLYFQRRQYAYLPALLALALFFLGLSGAFYTTEKRQYDRAKEKHKKELADFQKNIKKEYNASKDYYDSFLEDYLPDKADSQSELNLSEIEELLIHFGYEKPDWNERAEWKFVFSGLLLFLGLALVVGLPMLKFAVLFQSGAEAQAFRWLLLPVAYAGLGFWVAFQHFTQDELGKNSLSLLLVICAILLLVIIIRESRFFIQNRRFAQLAVYGFATAVTTGLLLAPAAAFLKGRVYKEKSLFPRAFLFQSLGIFTFLGATLVFCRNISNGEKGLVVGDFVLVAVVLSIMVFLLILIFLALRRQLRFLAAKKQTGTSRWSNRLAVLGLLFGALIIGVVGNLESLIVLNSSSEDVYEEEDDAYLFSAFNSTSGNYASESEEYVEPDSSLVEEDAEAGEDALTVGGEEKTGAAEGTLPEESAGADTEIAPGLLPLITALFGQDRVVREEARAALVANWKKDPGLVPALLEMNYKNETVNEGIWNTLYLLEQLTDKQLQSHQNELRAYLEWVAEKPYGPSTMKRIEVLRERVG